jgi:four helix bundle protein
MSHDTRAVRADKQRAMKERTNAFAKGVVGLVHQVANTVDGRHLAGQLVRCASSVAANYRAACRARSRREFAAKIGIVVEEADESLFWLEFARETDALPLSLVEPLANEANQLVAIFSATRTRTINSSITKSSNP